MQPLQSKARFILLDPEQEEAYRQVLGVVRSIKNNNPEHGEAFILNALVATGSEDFADQMENWIGNICEEDSRERSALVHGNGPRPDRIIPLNSMEEILGLPSDFDDSDRQGRDGQDND